MSKKTIALGNSIELIIEEPTSLSPTQRVVGVTSIIAQEFSKSSTLRPTTRQGSVPVKVGSALFRVYYQLRIKGVLDALTAYSEAIRHIENNPHLYDRRLAQEAVKVLRECHKSMLK